MITHVLLLALITVTGLEAFTVRPSIAKRAHSGGLSVARSSERASRSFLCMSDEWTSCSVVSNEREAEGLRLVKVQVPEELAAGYTVPGQYVKIKVGDGKPGFYAVASPPGVPSEMTFLVKETPNNGFFTEAKPGAALDLSSAQGKGFAIEEYFDTYRNDWACTNILLLAAGSGLAPIAAAIESPILSLKVTSYQTLFERTATLYIGARSEEYLPFRSKYEEWAKMGVNIIPVLSKPGEGWKGATGYVQDALRADGVKVPRNSGALLCGQKEMTENCREIMLEAGVFEGRILLNF